MKKYILLTALALAGCGGEDGKDGSNGVDGNTGTSGKDGTNGKDGANGKDGISGTNGKDFTPAVVKSLAGYWLLPNGGYLELLEDNNKRIIINGTQRIYSSNTDTTLATYLALAVGPYTPQNSTIRTEYNATYVALTHNLHVLATTTAIVGVRKTVTTFSLNSSDKLVINMKIYGATGLTIEADRTIISE